jgi:hypothetical protein
MLIMSLALSILKSVFIPLTQHYLSGKISLKDYVLTCMDTRSEHIHQYDYSKDAEAIDIMDAVYFDMDDVWLDYDPNDPDIVQYCNERSDSILLESEFKKRCQQHYISMLTVQNKYTDM